MKKRVCAVSLAVCVAAVAAGSDGGSGRSLEETDYGEPTRPQLRFSQKRGWVNDPNGLSYYRGEWHFFFQHNPTSTKWGNLHWGHAVSKDLVHWNEVGDTIGPEGDVLMFSGSAVVDRDGTAGFGADAHLLFYTAAPCGKPPSGVFRQELAWSRDGRTYAKWTENPVVPGQAGAKGDRDPFVFWHAPSKTWVMVLYLELGGQHVFRIFNSTDLRHWTPTQDLAGDRCGKGKWRYECPGLVQLKNETDGTCHWVLWGAGPLYDVGDFDGRRFTPREERLVAYVGGDGNSYYAGQVFNGAPDGRIIKVEWFRMQLGEDGFNQAFSLPQELSLRTTQEGLRLVRRPIRELASLRRGPAVTLDKFSGELAELDLSCDIRPGASVTFDLRGVELTYDADAATLTCCGRKAPWVLRDGRLELLAFLDRVGIEIFSKDGLQTFPVPEARPDRRRSDLKALTRGTVGNPAFRAYALRSIHESD